MKKHKQEQQVSTQRKKNSKKKKKLSEMFQKFISQEWKECAIY